MKFALDPLNFADQPEFGSQEKFGTPLQVYGWNNLWPTRELAISAKRKLTCCFCFAFGLHQFLNLKGTGFTGCGKTHPQRHEVSGHDFRRAVTRLKSMGL